MSNIFEQATRNKVRYESSVGLLSVEDVWDLPLTSRNKLSLDELAKNVNRKIRDAEEESFVTEKSAASERLILELDILKHIIQVKLTEKELKDQAAERKAKRERINEMIARKKDEALEGLSLEELEKLREEL